MSIPSVSLEREVPGLSPEQMELVLNISRTLTVTTDLDSLLRRIAEASCGLLDCQQTSIWLHDQTTGELWTKVVMDSEEIRLPVGRGIVGAAFAGNQVVHAPDPYQDPRFCRDNDRRRGFLTRSLLAAPMIDIDGRPIGVIEAVNKIRPPFTQQDQSLIHLLADQAGVAIQRHQLQLAAEHAAELRKEMDMARQVQEALLPKALPAMKGFDLAAWARPASITGGDCYDIWPLHDGRLAVFLADASGHGLAAALVVSLTRTLVRALCDYTDKPGHPAEILRRVDERLTKDLEPTRFVTVFLGFVASDGTVQWQSAGQGPVLFRRSSEATMEALPASVPPLNADREVVGELPALRLEPGGSLVLISDGILEAFNSDNKQFGTTRIIQNLDQDRLCAANECLSNLRAAVTSWQGKPDPVDDQTIIVLQRKR